MNKYLRDHMHESTQSAEDGVQHIETISIGLIDRITLGFQVKYSKYNETT